MNNRKKEIAKFFSGWEACHTVFHAYFLASGTPLTVAGVSLTPTLNMVAVVIGGLVAFALGIYGWRPSASSSRLSPPHDGSGR